MVVLLSSPAGQGITYSRTSYLDKYRQDVIKQYMKPLEKASGMQRNPIYQILLGICYGAERPLPGYFILVLMQL